MSDANESVIDRIEKESNALFAEKNMARQAAAVVTNTPKVVPPSGETVPSTPPAPDDELEIDGKKVEMPPEIKSEEGKKGWSTWKGMAKTKIKSLETKMAELDKKLAEAPKAEIKPYEEKIAALEKERQTLAEQLGQVSLERTPEFQRHYVEKTVGEIKKARDIVGAELADRAEAVLMMPESKHKREQLNALYAELDESQKIDIGTIRKAVMDTIQERDRELTNWKSNIEARNKVYQDRETAAQTQAREKFESAFSKTLATAQKELSLLQVKEGDAAWNARIEKDLAEAKDLFSTGDPERRAGAAILAATHRTALDQLKAAQDEIASLKKHIEATRSKTPNITGDGATETKTQPGVLPNGQAESLAERIARMSGEAGFLK